jgi:hypothetical protein
MNSAADIDRDDMDSDILNLESISPVDLDETQLQQPSDIATIPEQEHLLQASTVNFELEHRSDSSSTSSHLSTVEQLDVEAELDSLLTSLQLAAPHPPNLASAADSSSIAGILTTIYTNEPVTHIQQSIQELNDARQQLNAAQTQLQILHQRNQVVVDRVDASLREAKQIKSLSQSISKDRRQMAGMSVEMSATLNELYGLSNQITLMHAQIVEKSQTLQAKIAEIELGFIELSQSVRVEKEQFYELTVETIEKADVIRAQLADIIQRIDRDRDSISTLEAEIASVRHGNHQEIERQLDNFNRRETELISLCNDLQSLQKDRIAIANKFSRWLWVLSVAVGAIFILLIRILTSLK